LDDDGTDDDDEEEGIVEEVLEDVDFCVFKFSGVDLVEDLE
jgi:hypothetical protein